MEFASPPRKEIIYGICFSSKKRNHLWNLLILQEKKSFMEFASPPRKEITYGICFSSKKEITNGICFSSKKEITNS
jgi:hypothetical protein